MENLPYVVPLPAVHNPYPIKYVHEFAAKLNKTSHS